MVAPISDWIDGSGIVQFARGKAWAGIERLFLGLFEAGQIQNRFCVRSFAMQRCISNSEWLSERLLFLLVVSNQMAAICKALLNAVFEDSRF